MGTGRWGRIAPDGLDDQYPAALAATVGRDGRTHNYTAGVADLKTEATHPEGYFAAKHGAPLENITKMDPSWTWAAGQVISPPRAT